MNQFAEGYDVIGDVHGCATQLEVLLDTLGYRASATSVPYEHPGRQTGDLRRRSDRPG